MNAFATAIRDEATTTTTENGDKTYSTSLNACVDMFFKIGAIRGQGSDTAVSLFQKAYKEDADLAARLALWVRDVRGGAGERQVFRDILASLEMTDTDRLIRILPLVPEVGRWDDLFIFQTAKIKEIVLAMFAYALRDGDGLCAKWCPREGSKNSAFANELREFMGLSWNAYRKLVSSLSKTVEQQMCAKDWDNINFSHVPSVASSRYSKAFWKKQTERYGAFVQSATKGEVKINASTLFPYDVTKNSVDDLTKNALWNQLPNYVPEGVSFIPMIDLSGSMTSKIGSNLSCMDVAMSLGLYLAEKNSSAFRNLAMTFTNEPSWINIPETDSVNDKINHISRGAVGYSTNLDKGMDLILSTAIKNRVSQADMPKFLIVLSDMEFNSGSVSAYHYTNSSVAERTVDKFKDAGYEVPTIVWWNIQSRNQTTPIRFDTPGMVLVSGLSPTVTKTVLGGETTPIAAMLKTVGIERYDH